MVLQDRGAGLPGEANEGGETEGWVEVSFQPVLGPGVRGVAATEVRVEGLEASGSFGEEPVAEDLVPGDLGTDAGCTHYWMVEVGF